MFKERARFPSHPQVPLAQNMGLSTIPSNQGFIYQGKGGGERSRMLLTLGGDVQRESTVSIPSPSSIGTEYGTVYYPFKPGVHLSRKGGGGEEENVVDFGGRCSKRCVLHTSC